jgi:serine/threonine-protein kinase
MVRWGTFLTDLSLVGEVFAGRYELVDALGVGGSGSVWRAWDRRAGTYVAAKVLRQVDAASLMRFMREQSLRLDHPHILAPLGWAGEDDRVLLTMPLVTGGSVATVSGDYGPLPAPWVARIADQLLDALAFLHAGGLVHRDVKPANILLDATGAGEPRARLADFGIAMAVSEPRLTHVHHVVGTPGFQPPEVAAGADPHPAADVFAAGMTVAALITADGLDRRAPAVVPGPLASLVALMTQIDPGARPTAAQARVMLRDSGLLGVPLDGQVEVFDQMPDWPDGWGPDGPVLSVVEEAAQRPSRNPPPPSVEPTPSVEQAPSVVSRQARQPVETRGTPPSRNLPLPVVEEAAQRPSRNPQPGRIIAFTVIGLGVAAIIAALIVVLT